MRLIDADELKKQSYESSEWDGGGFHQRVVDESDIDDAPTIDAVPVVRCKDCEWYDNEHFRCENEKHYYISTSWDIWISRSHDPDHFCADGKRKDGEQE